MKTLNDIKHDMSVLYDQLNAGEVELKTASELANIAGKFLKAEQLDLATSIFLSGRPNMKTIDDKELKQIGAH